MFVINFSKCNGVFGVPNEVVDEHLKLCGALSLKVLLVLFRYGRPMEASELADILSQTEGDIKDALNQWITLGMIESTNYNENIEIDKDKKAVNEKTPLQASTVASETEKAEVKPKKNKTDKVKVVKPEKFRRMTRGEVNDIALTDDNIAILLDESQNIFGRPLSSGEGEMIVSFYHYYGMQPDILLMLLHYCKSVGKTRPGQYERIATQWLNRGIDTHEKAEKELLSLSKQENLETEVRKLLDIPNEVVVDIKARHAEYYKNWKSYDTDLLKLACKRMLGAINAFSMDYMNTILIEWQKKNITTVAQANSENHFSKKAKNKKASPDSTASYDLVKLEEMITHGSIWD